MTTHIEADPMTKNHEGAGDPINDKALREAYNAGYDGIWPGVTDPGPRHLAAVRAVAEEALRLALPEANEPRAERDAALAEAREQRERAEGAEYKLELVAQAIGASSPKPHDLVRMCQEVAGNEANFRRTKEATWAVLYEAFGGADAFRAEGVHWPVPLEELARAVVKKMTAQVTEAVARHVGEWRAHQETETARLKALARAERAEAEVVLLKRKTHVTEVEASGNEAAALRWRGLYEAAREALRPARAEAIDFARRLACADEEIARLRGERGGDGETAEQTYDRVYRATAGPTGPGKIDLQAHCQACAAIAARAVAGKVDPSLTAAADASIVSGLGALEASEPSGRPWPAEELETALRDLAQAQLGAAPEMPRWVGYASKTIAAVLIRLRASGPGPVGTP